MSAALAWLIATEVLGHPQPFFAPVAAIITLGITVGQRGQRAAEVALGVALGIAVADLLVLQIGTGTAQLALVVAAGHLGRDLPRQRADAGHAGRGLGRARGDAAAADRRRLASSASSTRWSAAAWRSSINALVLPARPLDLMRRAAGAAAGGARGGARGRRGGGRAARPASSRSPRWSARAAIDELGARFDEAVDVSRETTRYAPPRRRSRGRGRELRGRRRADRPRRPQRARARARHDPRALARRERPARDRRRAARPRRRRPRAGARARRPGRARGRSASPPCARPPRRRWCSSAPATCR